MNNVSRRALCSAATIALIATVCTAQPAWAQSNNGVEEVVVTGTSIRGVQPVGVNLQTVGRIDIDKTSAQTVQDILKQVPALSNLGQASQGNTTPAIHNLGAVSSYSTLVLIDGHRFSLGGQTQTLPDPGILPPDAIERVEVLADAASSVYGSDAVAGVINFVTRKDFSGLQLSAQHGFGDHYNTLFLSGVAGATFDHGYLMLTGAHSYKSPLFQRYRDFLNPDHRAQGGTNFANNNCDIATFQPGATGGTFLGNSATAAIVTPSCSTYQYATALGQDVRTNGMLKAGYDVTDNFKLTADVNEYHADMRCIAVPVRDGGARVVAALSATGRPENLGPDDFDRVRSELAAAAALITERLNPRLR